jgi:adenylate cyclase, class 2
VATEIEARFVEVDVAALVGRLRELGAEDRGAELLRETIFYDRALTWRESGRELVRVREGREGVFVSYKHAVEDTATGTEEIEFRVEDRGAVEEFLRRLGLVAYRQQEKRRHSFQLGEVRIDLDSWPKVPTYVELEGPSEATIREAAGLLGLEWSEAIFGNAGLMIEERYGIPARALRWFTFERVE